MSLESTLHVYNKTVIFKKTLTQDDVDRLNTINALSERPVIKVCTLCKHYEKVFANDRCNRDRYDGFNQVTGKNERLGKLHFCEHNREVDDTYPHSVEDGTLCGAIGQYWEPIDPKPKRKWFWQK